MQLEQDIKKKGEEIAQLQESQAQAEKLRAKEAAENHAEETELTKCVEGTAVSSGSTQQNVRSNQGGAREAWWHQRS